MRTASLLVAVLSLCPAGLAFGDVIYIPEDQPTIQAGIDAASDGDTVLVANGTFTGPGNRDIDFGGKAIVVQSEDGPDNCIIDCEGEGRGFYFHSGEDPDSVVRGLTIRGGTADAGGGIYCFDNSSPTIAGNIITECTAEFGNGINCSSDASPRILNNSIIMNSTEAINGGGIHCYECESSSPVIIGNTISDNSATWGGGIFCMDCTGLIISSNLLSGNSSSEDGGGVFVLDSDTLITGNIFTANQATVTGGGVSCYLDSTPSVLNNIFLSNTASSGGGIGCSSRAMATIANNTLVGNSSNYGGGISVAGSSTSADISNCILWDNDAPDGKEISVATGAASIDFSDVEGGLSSVRADFGGVINWGSSMIETNPQFVSGPPGDYCLSQTAAGQATDSPCLDTGYPASEMIEGSTRTDMIQDEGILDMGYHYPFPVYSLITGPGAGYENPPLVRVFPLEHSAIPDSEFQAYGPSHYGVNVARSNVDGDLRDEILTGAGPGPIFGPHVRGFYSDGAPYPGLNFLAYGTNKWGVNVTAGDLDGDGDDEIITGAGPGAVFGPHVRGWDYDGTGTVSAIPSVSYFAYGTPKWGVNASCGDIDGDGYDEIVTGAGPGAVYGPHVRGWNVDGGTAAAMPGCSFFAYGTNRMGVNVTCGDVDGDGIDEIITGPGPSPYFGAHVRGFEMNGTPMPGLSFFAWPPDEVRYGAEVFAEADLNGDGRNEIVVGQGPDPEASGFVTVFEYDGSGVTLWFSLEAFPGMTHGANVAAGRF